MYTLTLTPEQEKLFNKRRADALAFSAHIGMQLRPDFVLGLDITNLTALLAAFSVFAAEADKTSEEASAKTRAELAANPDLLDLRARTLYNAYCESTGYRSAITGDPLPRFEDTREGVKDAWKAAAHSTFVHPAFGRM